MTLLRWGHLAARTAATFCLTLIVAFDAVPAVASAAAGTGEISGTYSMSDGSKAQSGYVAAFTAQTTPRSKDFSRYCRSPKRLNNPDILCASPFADGRALDFTTGYTDGGAGFVRHTNAVTGRFTAGPIAKAPWTLSVPPGDYKVLLAGGPDNFWTARARYVGDSYDPANARVIHVTAGDKVDVGNSVLTPLGQVDATVRIAYRGRVRKERRSGYLQLRNAHGSVVALSYSGVFRGVLSGTYSLRLYDPFHRYRQRATRFQVTAGRTTTTTGLLISCRQRFC